MVIVPKRSRTYDKVYLGWAGWLEAYSGLDRCPITHQGERLSGPLRGFV